MKGTGWQGRLMECTLPIKYILMTRRLSFLQYILKEDEDSLMLKCLMAQIEAPVQGDWSENVVKDMSGS